MKTKGGARRAGIRWLAGALPALAMSAASAATIHVAPALATPGGTAPDTQRIQQAIDAAHAAGGGVVELDPGTYVSGTLFLRSGVQFLLAEGATLLGSTSLADYPECRPEYRSNTDRQVTRSLIYAEKQEDVSIAGPGHIDFRGGAPVFQTGQNNDPRRPFGIRFISCRRVEVRDVTLINSAQWLQHYLNCDDVAITHETVFNHVNQNNDGIDIDGCRHVRVRDCRVDSDDDGICLKSNGPAPCEDVLVEDCVVSSHCNPLKLGTETTGGFHRIVIRDCRVVPSASRSRHINGVETALSAIALMIVDGGTLDDVQVSDIIASESLAPIFIRLGNRARRYTSGAPAPGIGHVGNIHIRNLTARAVGATSSHIIGLSPEHPIENVTLEGIRITSPGGGSPADAAAMPPLDPKGYPNPDRLGRTPAFGLYGRDVTGLVLRNVSFELRGKDARLPLVLEHVNALTLADVTAVTPGSNRPLVRLQNCGTVEVLSPACYTLSLGNP